MTADESSTGKGGPFLCGLEIAGNPPSAHPDSCPAGFVSDQVPGQVADDWILENHFFPGLRFEFQDTEARRVAGRRDLPYLAAVEDTGAGQGSGGSALTAQDATGHDILLCALSVTDTDHDFRFYGWVGAERNVTLEAANAIRYMQRGRPTRILLIREDLFLPHGQSQITAALNAYTSGAFLADRVERSGDRFCWAVLTACSRTFIDTTNGLLGFEGPPHAATSIIPAGDLQRRLAMPWHAGFGGHHDFDSIAFINSWETRPVSLAGRIPEEDEEE